MSIVPKVTAHAETAALWYLVNEDPHRLAAALADMSQAELRIYRKNLRMLARLVDDEIFRQYNIPGSVIGPVTTTIHPKTETTEGSP